MDAQIILDTRIVESVWRGGAESDWVSRVVAGEIKAAVSAVSVAEAVRRLPDRRAEIQLVALLSLVEVVELNSEVAKRAGGIARDLDSDDSSVLPNAVVAATSLEAGLPVACVDADFFEAMGCEIASLP